MSTKSKALIHRLGMRWARSEGRLIVYQNQWMRKLRIPPMPIPALMYDIPLLQSRERRLWNTFAMPAGRSRPSDQGRGARSALSGNTLTKSCGPASGTANSEISTMTKRRRLDAAPKQKGNSHGER